MSVLTVRSIGEIDKKLEQLAKISEKSLANIVFNSADALETLFRLKFEPVGLHPVEGYALNFVEQINQTWTHYCAFIACKKLMTLHPQIKEWMLAPGAHAAQALDIMSCEEGSIGAETFAAVDPKNNKKLEKDIKKLECRNEAYRYVFFLSPKFPETRKLEVRNGIEVWSLDLSFGS